MEQCVGDLVEMTGRFGGDMCLIFVMVGSEYVWGSGGETGKMSLKVRLSRKTEV